MSQKGEFSYKPQDVNCEANINEFIFNLLLSKNAFVQLVLVNNVSNDSDGNPLVDVTPMISGFSADGSKIPNSPVYNIPVWRLQAGNSAVVMDPVVGDIGAMVCMDRDITNVRAEKKESLPASMRTHSKSDGIYLGGILNKTPTQYAKFSGDGIELVTPLSVSIKAEGKISLNAPDVEINGNLSQAGGNSTFDGSFSALGEVSGKGINLSTHVHGGVESGGSNTQGPQ